MDEQLRNSLGAQTPKHPEPLEPNPEFESLAALWSPEGLEPWTNCSWDLGGGGGLGFRVLGF